MNLSIDMETWTIILIIGITVLVALFWGSVLAVRLPEFDTLFDRKPFNCRPCLTFHFTWILSMLFAIVTDSLTLFIWGSVAAFATFLIVTYIDNKKITK